MGKVAIELEKGLYLPGEDVKGVARIYLDKPVSERSAGIYLTGKERTEVSYETSSYSGGHSHQQRQTAVEDREFVHQEFPLPLPLGEKGKVQPGDYKIPFRFALPQQLPPTYRGKHARIWYAITAKIDVPLGIDIGETLELPVISTGQRDFRSSPTNISSTTWGSSESPGVTFVLERGEYRRGEVISGKCNFRNPGGKTLRKIDVCLAYVEYAVARGHAERAEVMKLESAVPIEGKVSEGGSQFSIQIPQQSPLTYESSLSNLKCSLRVGLDIAWGSDVAASEDIRVVGDVGAEKEVPYRYVDQEKRLEETHPKKPGANQFCPYCGAAIKFPNSEFCSNCGASL
ncbi:MAG: hypothetical protein WED05_10230 [Candidatus Atabeyarchaeum deiterrae]